MKLVIVIAITALVAGGIAYFLVKSMNDQQMMQQQQYGTGGQHGTGNWLNTFSGIMAGFGNVFAGATPESVTIMGAGK